MSRILAKKMNIERKISFNEFFSSGTDETISPFLTAKSRKWAKNLPLRVSIFSALLLLAAFITSYYPKLLFLSLLLQVMVYFLVGTPALIEAVKEIVKFKINIDVLMVLAAFLAIFIHSSIEGALLLVLFSISSSMEAFVTSKAKSTLNQLSEMMPTKAMVINGQGKISEKSIKDVQIKEHILVRVGEVIPLDGKIIEGSSMINVAHLTGEHLPINVKEGMDIVSGAINLDGTLKIEVTKTGAQSTISRIIQLICDAHGAKPKLQSWFDRFSQRYSIFVILSSFAFALLMPILFSHISYLGAEGSIYRALAYLIAASPCALIIATPIAYISAINASAKQGIILKGGITLDTLAQIKSIAFDKTGTLTSGHLECESVTDLHLNSVAPEKLKLVLSIARALEQHAIHPIAEAIIKYADSKNIEPAQVQSGRAIPGHGIEGEVLINGEIQRVAIGNLAYIASKALASDKKILENMQNEQGHLMAAMQVESQTYLFQFMDHLKKDVAHILKELKQQLHLNIYILSGDNEISVERIAKHLSVDRYYSGLKPEDKLFLVEQYVKEGGLAMVGDGINDTPALARASIGISLGHFASHMANEVAEVVLIKDDLSLIKKVMLKARHTLAIVKQNVVLASSIIIGISIPALFGFIPLWLAVICHEGGTVLVALNSLRLLKEKK